MFPRNKFSDVTWQVAWWWLKQEGKEDIVFQEMGMYDDPFGKTHPVSPRNLEVGEQRP